MRKKLNVALLGAAGAVGQEILKVLQERNFPVNRLKLLATARSAGASFNFRGEQITVEEAQGSSFEGVDVAFFAATTSASQEYAPEAVRRGCVVIDKSNAFRMDPEVPLVVPEVNSDAIDSHKGIIASPNCSTIQFVVAVKPIHDAARITRAVVSTYQSVSGTGREAMDELREEAEAVLSGASYSRKVYQHQIAFNLIPHIDSFDELGYTLEEMKLVNETRKILNEPDMPIVATAVRVPVFIGHSEAVLLETARSIDPEEVREILSKAPGVKLMDEPANGIYPMPVLAAGGDEVFVGRIRRDISYDKGVVMWVVADNLRKGAATNAIQIAEVLLAKNLI